MDIEINDYYNDSSDNILDIMAEPYTRNKHWISYQNQPAYSYIKDIELKIGEQLIDKHTGQYYDIYDELYEDDHKNMDYMTGKDRKIGQWPPKDKVFGNKYTLVPKEIELFVPLKFWFNKGIEQSLPIIALQYHDVTIDITFRDLRSILIWHPGEYTGTSNDGEVSSTSIHHINFTADERRKINNRKLIKPEIELWANYIYLDTDERKRFAKSSHEYLIEQVQIIHDRYKETVDIPFNHSVKSLFWVIQNKNCFKEDTKFQNNRHELSNDTVSGNWQNQKIEVLVGSELEEENDYTIISNYHNGFTQNNNYLFYNSHQDNVNLSYLNYLEKPEHFKRCKIIMNGVDRIEFKPSTYFRTIQPHECKLNIPQKNIHMYSFSLEPKKFQPTGSCNFSKLDSVQLKFDGDQNYANYDIFVYAHNYNILRIMEGMSGILYNS